MASQVAHVIYANKYFAKYPSGIDKDEFILGCIFPDIRKIDEKIRRKETHLCFDPIDLNFSGFTSFQAGWKFHLYCDMKREEILNKYNFYSLDSATDFWNLPAKFLEDEIAYNDCRNWEKLIHYFNNIPQINSGIYVSRETLELWYAIIAKYIEKRPDSKLMKVFISKQPKLANFAEDIVKTVDKLRKDAKLVGILTKVKDEIVS
jgi:hypothetical protein